MFETPGRSKRITEFWVYIFTDPTDDCEGVPAIRVADPVTGEHCAMPMLGADSGRVQSLRRFAEQMAAQSGRPLKLVRFTQMEIVATINPKDGVDMEQEFDRA